LPNLLCADIGKSRAKASHNMRHHNSPAGRYRPIEHCFLTEDQFRRLTESHDAADLTRQVNATPNSLTNETSLEAPSLAESKSKLAFRKGASA
jgi:vacuolar-type H+-ATPase subunit C/Vma6